MAKIGWLFLALLAVLHVCDGSKILFISPLPGKSHGILGSALVKHLLDAGHEVTFITSVMMKPRQNLRQIDVTKNWNLFPSDMLSIKSIMDGAADVTDNTMMNFMFHFFATETLNNPNVENFLADQSQQFDLIIAEWMFNELYCGLAAIYDAPFVWFSTLEPHGQILALVDESLNTAYIGFHIDSIPPFTFTDRVTELWLTFKNSVIKNIIVRFMQHWDYKKIIVPHIEARGKVPPSFEDLKYNSSLVLGNSHVSLGQATTLPQMYKPIAGYHIAEKADPLPDDLENIMKNSKDGVIYFSMGSNLKSKDIPEELKQDILKIFGTLKQTVLWKFEEDLPNLPKNVHILKWAPQQSILAHPKCVLFITHGGLLSTTETVHAGVPIIGIPVFADQFANVNRAVQKGFAKRVSLSFTMANELKAAIEDILGNSKYTEKVKELSLIYHDRPVKPEVELVHWVEHVIKTKGALHLRSPGLHVPWYQKMYLDLALLVLLIIFVIVKLLKKVSGALFPKKSVAKTKTH